MRRIGLTLVVLLGLSACDGKPDNPLIGTWAMVPEKGNALSEGLGMLMQGRTLEFRADTMIASGEATKVTYELADGKVLVFPEGRTKGDVYIILGEDRIANELPLGQRFIFERVKK